MLPTHPPTPSTDPARGAFRRRLPAPPFPDVTVILGDPRLPDATKVESRYAPEDLEAVARMKAALGRLPEYRVRFLDDHRTLVAELTADPPAFVLNLCDTGFRNVAAMEPNVPALLELLGVPYSGSPPACLARCVDKALVRAIAQAHGVPVPAERWVEAGDHAAVPPFFPALIKPNAGDGSVGIWRASVVRNAREAAACLDRLRRALPDRDVLVQEFLDGPEYSIGLVGNPQQGFAVLPPLEVDYGGLDPALPRILAYESKTVPDSPYWRQIAYREARLDATTRRALAAHAALLFRRLGCRDYARFDFRTGADGAVKLLEVNPNPAWSWDGKLQLMAGFAGHDEAGLFRMILAAAQERAVAGCPGCVVP
jgi:D-alanine-D-alanine ligase